MTGARGRGGAGVIISVCMAVGGGRAGGASSFAWQEVSGGCRDCGRGGGEGVCDYVCGEHKGG